MVQQHFCFVTQTDIVHDTMLGRSDQLGVESLVSFLFEALVLHVTAAKDSLYFYKFFNQDFLSPRCPANGGTDKSVDDVHVRISCVEIIERNMLSQLLSLHRICVSTILMRLNSDDICETFSKRVESVLRRI